MIREIKLENWKSFKNLTFKPQSMNIIIGANASGKSNFLEALELLQKKARGISDDEIEKIRGGKGMFHRFGEKNFKITAKFEIDEQIKKYEIFNEKDMLLEEKDVETLKELKAITILDPIPREIRGQSVTTADKYILKDCSNIIPIIASLPFDKKQELENRLKGYLNELLDYEITKVNFSKDGEVGEYNQLYLEEKIGGKIQKLFSNIISEGTLRFIVIISALLIQPKGTIFAIEELDNGIAPAKTKILMKIIDEISLEREVDVIFTTHNTILMNYLDEELLDFIFFTYRGKDGNSKIVRIKDLNRFPKLLSYGPIGDLMATNKILDFIEGEENE